MEDLADFEKAWQKLKVYRESMLSATNDKNLVKTGIKKIIKKSKE